MKSRNVVSVALVVVIVIIGCSIFAVDFVRSGYGRSSSELVEETPGDHFGLSLEPAQDREQIEQIASRFQSIEQVSFTRWTSVGFGSITMTKDGETQFTPGVLILCVDPQFAPVRGLKLAEGRYLDAGDDGDYVAVIGAALAELTGWELGSKVSHPFLESKYTVIGIFKHTDASFIGSSYTSVGKMVLVPFGSPPIANHYLPAYVRPSLEKHHMSRWVWASVKQGESASEVGERLRAAIAEEIAWPAVFYVGHPAKIIHSYVEKQTNQALTVSTLVAIAVAMLNVSGLIMMQTYLRAKEIGIKRACGASTDHIRREFLHYYAQLSALGGVLATIIAITVFPPVMDHLGIPYSISPLRIAFLALFIMLIGPLCSLIPASIAARMSPLDTIADRRAWGVRRRRIDLRQIFISLGFGTAIAAVFFVSSLGASSLRDVDLYMRAAGADTVVIEEPPAGSVPVLAKLTHGHYESLCGPCIRQYGEMAWLDMVSTRAGTTPNDLIDVTIFSTDGDVSEVMGYRMESGRWASSPDEVVLGSVLSQRFFPGAPAIGQQIVLGTDLHPFTVVGVLSKRPANLSDLDADRDYALFVHHSARQAVGGSSPQGPKIYLKARVPQAVPMLIEVVKKGLADVHEEAEHLLVHQALGPLLALRALRASYHVSVLAISVLSILVAAVGISMLALVQTSEMSRSLAILRACGATRRATISGVLAEIISIICFAAALGVVLSYGLYRIVITAQGLPQVSNVLWVVAGIAISILCALTAAYIPVRSIAKQPPASLL